MIVPRQLELFAVIGNPVSHSLSPVMMNVAFKNLGFAGVYVALQVDELAKDLSTLSEVGFRGLSVTLPHKENAFGAATKVDETAQQIGAVNTLRRLGDGGWEGFNTDWIGADRALEAKVPLRGKRALVIGAGGVARAVVFGLKQGLAEVTITNRSSDRGSSLAGAFQCDFIPMADLERSLPPRQAYEIVVQCTSVGLMGAESHPLVSSSFFRPGMVVMDTVYRPLWTPFLNAAREAGCTTISGIDMLLYQGVAQLEWWLRRSVPQACTEVMKEALMRALGYDDNDQED